MAREGNQNGANEGNSNKTSGSSILDKWGNILNPGGSKPQPESPDNSGTPTPSPTPTQPNEAVDGTNYGDEKIVPGKPQEGTNEVNVVDKSADIINNPEQIVGGSGSLVEQSKDSVMTGNEEGTTIDPNDPKYSMDAGGLNQEADQAEAEQAENVEAKDAQGYEVEKTEDKVAENEMEGVKGELSDGSIITDIPEIDVGAIADGTDPEGVGEALKDFASLDPDDVDPKATVKGQLDMLQDEFFDPRTGEPRIPNWAAATARSVARITAFSGSSGSAATAAMAQALMESSIPVAQADAQFMQTLTLQNLSNEQASIINRANVLSNMTMANQEARVAAAIQNAQAFLALDMKNLDNEQQAAVINNQNRINSILEDAKAVNTERMFTAQSQNEKDMFYDNLNASINQFNVGQMNGMNQFNTNQSNSMKQFNAEMENNREQFYKNMQFQIDTANAKWRQTVTLQEDAQAFEAAATDVKNTIGLTTEMLNQIWDRSDSLLQYAWQSGENEADRKAQMAIAQFQAKAGSKSASKAGWGQVAGSLVGSVGGKLFDKLF